MATYLVLVSYSQAGVQNMKESPARLDAARQLARSMGAELKEFFLTLGRYDAASVVEAPDDATVARFALAVAGRGAVRTETLRAFTEEEYRKICSELP
jgi:uncharacterized protein with GYD domain